MDSFELEPQPETQTAGALEPPRRRPPTAVGTGQLPPRGRGDSSGQTDWPDDDGEPYAEPTLVRRVALALLFVQLLIVAAVLVWPLGWTGWVATGAIGTACVTWQRMTGRRARVTDGAATGPHTQDESLRRSA